MATSLSLIFPIKTIPFISAYKDTKAAPGDMANI